MFNKRAGAVLYQVENTRRSRVFRLDKARTASLLNGFKDIPR